MRRQPQQARSVILFVVAVLSLAATVTADPVLYVDVDATGEIHDGSSWCNAFTDLQSALDLAGEGYTILVANGTYTPDPSDLPNPREATFLLVPGVTIEGGYAGCGAADPDERDLLVYETTLSGDLNGDDSGGGSNAENAYHVLTSGATDQTTVLDGFTITAGNANGPEADGHNRGGGMYIDGGAPTLIDCTFAGNSAEEGGGMYNDGGSPTLLTCVFSANTSTFAAGGMHNSGINANPSLIDCTFSENSTDHYGGAMRNDGGAPTLRNCIFHGNTAGSWGGAMDAFSAAPTLVNCLFSRNSTEGAGGAMHNDLSGVTLTNCTLYGNVAGDTCGGVFNYVGVDLILTNSILWGNADSYGSGESSQVGTNPSNMILANYNCIEGLTGGLGGIGNIGDDPMFVSTDGADHRPVHRARRQDDLRLRPRSPCIDAGDNTAVPPLVTTDLDGNPRIVNDTVDMGAYEFQGVEAIPTLSEWGMVIMVLLLLTVATIVLVDRRSHSASVDALCR
jgi:hypothetical protein